MAQESQRDGESEGSAQLSTVDAIRRIAAKNARASLDSDENLLLYLKSWWSRTYNRPLKDPLLLAYTLEELLYEFYDRYERQAAEQERAKAEELHQEEAKDKANLDWAEMEEKKELEQLNTQPKPAVAPIISEPVNDPTKDPDNIRWMEEQIRIAKEVHGDSFGEDVELNFDK